MTPNFSPISLIFRSGPLKPKDDVRAVTARAERLYGSLLGLEREELGRYIDHFEQILDRQDPQEIKRAIPEFTEVLDQFDRDIWQ